LATLTREIADESQTDELRAMASVLLKNFIINRQQVSEFIFSSSFLFLQQIGCAI
jgi:hypothetical protein